MSLICFFLGCKPRTFYHGGYEDRPCYHCERCGRALGLWSTPAPWPDPPYRPQTLKAVTRVPVRRMVRAKVKCR